MSGIQPLKAMRWEEPGNPNSLDIRLFTYSLREAEALEAKFRNKVKCSVEARTPVTKGLSEPNLLVTLRRPIAAQALFRDLTYYGAVTAEQLAAWGFETPLPPELVLAKERFQFLL